MYVFLDVYFYKVEIVYSILMSNKTLSDYVEGNCLNGYIFESKYPIASNGLPIHYEVHKKMGDDLRVFPVDYTRGKMVAREKSVGLNYWQHKNDLVK